MILHRGGNRRAKRPTVRRYVVDAVDILPFDAAYDVNLAVVAVFGSRAGAQEGGDGGDGGPAIGGVVILVGCVPAAGGTASEAVDVGAVARYTQVSYKLWVVGP